MTGIVNPLVVNIGVSASETIKCLPNYNFLPLVRWNILQYYRLFKIVNRFKPDVINAYDEKSLFIGRLLSLFYNIPIVYTKCGGSNGSKFIPFASRYVLYSGENYEHYKNNGYNDKSILIPNRVLRPTVEHSVVKDFLKYLNIGDGKIILRISRFNRYYDLTFNQSVRLYEEIKSQENNLHLVFVGIVQDQEYFNELCNRYSSTNIHFVTENRFTHFAARLIPAVDFVVATGRGAMEACAHNKRVFCPTKNQSLPIELTLDSFKFLSYYNFSERSEISNVRFKITTSTSTSTKELFDKYFCTDAVIDKYYQLYKSICSEKSDRINNLSTLLFQAIRFFRPKFKI
ncbi:hypothetical protein CWE15_11545 [Aliidiomarina taiwanensis]|uniref:Glycosyl transferase family 1 domain-containing protein n=2 Tax=Aliidiomarina taiwanensis TaxID=946228 RepID=A0A432WTM4_9GAMM|nr:hypothetical protein CWE15_11545 [Aliidiomarina taiwanensis]